MSSESFPEPLPRIAIVGMAVRFPGAADVDTLWRNLRDGVESVRFFSREELVTAGVGVEEIERPEYVPARAVLDDVEGFDAGLFRMTPREAEITDPQHRIFLECCRDALESAGYAPESMPGAVGVYGGAGASRYLLQLLTSREPPDGLSQTLGTDKDFLTTRVSYKLGLEGPSLGVQTACSTSLVAVHLACQALLSGECDTALAGGVSVRLPQVKGYLYRPGGILSPDGHCRAFDASARGCVSGNGAGVVVLKRLEDAIADGDPIEAVIAGSAINNDGTAKAGYTAPSVRGQSEVIGEALALAGVDPALVRYVEAHGTGTPLGDPIEVEALNTAFADAGTPARAALGSIKSNFGHLDAAAGVAGLVKAALALSREAIPPSLHFEEPNPEVPFDDGPFYVPTTTEPWPADGEERWAGVSSFGIGGTNAHVVLTEAPRRERREPARWPVQLLELSARSGPALESATDELAGRLRGLDETAREEEAAPLLADVAYTLAVGRTRFAHRRAWVARDLAEAAEILEARDPERLTTRHLDSDAPRPAVFLLPGQGTQHGGMGAGLSHEPVFRHWLDRCSELLEPELGEDLRPLLLARGEAARAADERLRRTDLAQSALFAVEYALARTWMEWGVRPESMLGHSLGELVAACLAGVLPLEAMASAVAVRGRAMRERPGGSMLAVPMERSRVEARLEGTGVVLAAANAADRSVVSGPDEAVRSLAEALAGEGIETRPLDVSHAFHSPAMEPAAERFARHLEGLGLAAPEIPFLSNVTGTWIRPEEARDPGYWAEQMLRPVLFAEALERLRGDEGGVLLEVGPGHTLAALARRAGFAHDAVLAGLPREREDGEVPAARAFLATAARLRLAPVEADVAAPWKGEERRRVRLPAYPHERRRAWVEPDPSWLALADRRRRLDPSRWLHAPVWRQAVPAAPGEDAAGATWLLLQPASGDGPARSIAERLESAGAEVVTAAPGERTAEERPGHWTVDLRGETGYGPLLAAVRDTGRPLRILHLASLGASPDELLDPSGPGFGSLAALARALGGLRLARGLRVDVVGAGAASVTGTEEVRAAAATLPPACRVLSRELPAVLCRHVDLDPATLGEPGALAATLLPELLAAADEPEVALRGRHRFVPGFEPLEPEPTAEEQAPPILRPGAVALVTGGLGGVGSVLAETLGGLGAKLAIVGREIPDAGPGGEASDRRPERRRRLEELGVETLFLAADLGDEAEARRVVERVRERFGGIDVVVHAAGVAGGRLLEIEDAGEAARVWAPKVRGTLALDRALEDGEPELFVLCSSLAARTGGQGQASYAAANAFLDAFARERQERRAGWTLSIGWDTWREVGMAVDTEVPARLRARREEQLRTAMRSFEAAASFLRLLAGPRLPNLLVSTRDLDQRLADASAAGDTVVEPPSGAPEAGEPTAEPERRRTVETPYEAPRDELEESLVEIWSRQLGIAEVGVHDDFFALGGDSLTGLQILDRVRELFAIELPAQSLFDRPTVAGLAEEVESRLVAEVESMSDEEAERWLAEESGV